MLRCTSLLLCACKTRTQQWRRGCRLPVCRWSCQSNLDTIWSTLAPLVLWSNSYVLSRSFSARGSAECFSTAHVSNFPATLVVCQRLFRHLRRAPCCDEFLTIRVDDHCAPVFVSALEPTSKSRQSNNTKWRRHDYTNKDFKKGCQVKTEHLTGRTTDAHFLVFQHTRQLRKTFYQRV